MNTVVYTVPKIHCANCVHTVETELSELPGVESVKANNVDQKVMVSFDAPASDDQIRAALAEINYPAEA
ncbi:MAG: heavy-metal-associated domain-containing protein [Anaerolineales bacterium]|nr:heavy-metal-associated domain-containing protein [Anaerolineales bacterium]MCW5854811.1 heavy-metal-associated domain-containing protein [Anaerolineales bacterium]